MAFEQSRLAPVELRGLQAPVLAAADVVFGTSLHRVLTLDLYQPAGHLDLPMPVVVFIHGGGWHGGDKNSYRDLAARLASHDYLCAPINYRLSGEAPFPAALEDCKCAVRWLRSHAAQLGADADRFAVWGHSAGGHLAAMLALTPGKFEGEGGNAQASSEVRWVLCFSTPFDLPALGSSLRGSVDSFLCSAARDLASPITYVGAANVTFFVCHGDQDDLVLVEQSDRFVAALRQAGLAHEFLRVPRAGHDLERYSEDIFARALAFLEKHLKQGPD